MERPAEDYREELLAKLKNIDYCAKYLAAAYQDSTGTFLVALRNVAEAQKGMTKLANEAGVNRENLYRMLSEGGNPRLNSLRALLMTIGIRAKFEPMHTAPLIVNPQTPQSVLTKTKVAGLVPNTTGSGTGKTMNFATGAHISISIPAQNFELPGSERLTSRLQLLAVNQPGSTRDLPFPSFNPTAAVHDAARNP